MLCCWPQDDEQPKKSIKLLLLGTGDSGKSTVAKQFKNIYLAGFTVDERKNIIPAVHQNLLSAYKEILHGVMKTHLPPEVLEHAEFISKLSTHQAVTPELAERFKFLLQTNEVSEFLRRSNEMQRYGHFEYFMEKIDEIASCNYIPTVDDILRTRVRTTGINETTYQYKNMNFSVLDMGGQRSERKKWLYFFEDVTAVIYVLALDEYDMPLREDPHVNRMLESLTVFKNNINNKSLSNTTVILFLNKIDLFKHKITRSDLKQCFPDYTGGSNYDAAMEFIGKKFLAFNMNTKRTVFIHPTCATDTTQISMVLAAIKLTLVHNVLKDMAIL